jgi:hypothetical protein
LGGRAIVSQTSVKEDATLQAFPVFTGSHWKTTNPLGILS